MADSLITPTLPETLEPRLITRRQVGALAAAFAGSTVVPLRAAQARERSRAEQIREHMEAIVALLREEIPGDYQRLRIFGHSGWGPTEVAVNSVCVRAVALKLAWEPERRVKSGGAWVERETHNWWINGAGQATLWTIET